jgi:hypothetical protein
MSDLVHRLRLIVAEPAAWCKTDVEYVEDAADEIERLTAERDEARRMYCYAIPENCDEHEARKIAWERGWDCFKEDGK